MSPRILDIIRLVPLGIVVSAFLLAYFHAGLKALNPLGGYQLWPKVSKKQFLGGLVLLGIIEIINWIVTRISG